MDPNQTIILDSAKRFAKHGSFDATRFFDALDKSLDVKLLTVVVPMRASDDGLAVFGGDESIGLSDLQSLHSIIDDFPRLYDRDVAPDVRGMIWQMRVDAKQALQASIDKELAPTDRIAFASLPLFAQDLCVFAVLELSMARVCSLYTIPCESHWGLSVGTSLVSKFIYVFIYERAVFRTGKPFQRVYGNHPPGRLRRSIPQSRFLVDGRRREGNDNKKQQRKFRQPVQTFQ
jgi:hypothetical protein